LAEEFPYVLNAVSADADMLAGPLRAAVAELGTAGAIDWLAPERAFDIPFLGTPEHVKDATRAVATVTQADINVVAMRGRRKRLLVADMDSTIIGCECLDELADMAGLKPHIAPITERAMKGEIAFEPALRERVAMLKGLRVDALERTWRERVRLNPGAKAMVATMKAHGAGTLLVSGGFTYFTSRVAREAGFDAHRANMLLDDGVALTGKVAEPVLGSDAKLRALEGAAAEAGIGFEDALALGDGANDLAMIARAGLGVAYRAKPVVAEAAGASIAHSDLRAVLYLQGYRDEEIIGP
jgi:phosphoserine phosphatase